MTIKEEKRDLFTVPQGYYLAHCISGDFALGSGIAVQFNKHYNMKNKLKSRYGQAYGNCCILIDNVFNLITKEKGYHKPTYDSLREALEDMREQIVDEEVTKLAMPLIGCGLDRLEWSKVKEILEDVFELVDVDILVCLFSEEDLKAIIADEVNNVTTLQNDSRLSWKEVFNIYNLNPSTFAQCRYHASSVGYKYMVFNGIVYDILNPHGSEIICKEDELR